jgi:predicted DNA-binding transcriptional regulator AlpA
MNVIATRPGALSPEAAAEYLSLSLNTMRSVFMQDASAPKPIQLAERRVGYRLAELDAWLASRPVADNLPPDGSGYGRAGKTNTPAETRQTAQKDTP